MIRRIVCGLAVVLGATSAHADSACEQGYHEATPAERAAMTAVLETGKSALPRAPQGWVILGDENISVPSGVCWESESVPWPYSFTRHYQRVDDQEARQRVLAEAAADVRAETAAKQPRMDALTAKMQSLGTELGTAAQKGDSARIDEINKEIEKVTAEYQKLIEEGGAAEKMNAAGATALQDLEMSVAVNVNPQGEAPGEGAQALPVPAGAQSAFRWTDEHEGVRTGHALVLLGGWQPRSEGGFQRAPRSGVAATAAHAISVRVHADPSRLAATFDAIDFAKIASMLTQ